MVLTSQLFVATAVFKDLKVDVAKKSPGKLRFGSAGTGASEHLSSVLFT